MPGRAPKTPMRRSTPSSDLIVGRRKLSTWRWWSEHNAPAGGFSTSIAQSSGRTGRRDLAPHPHEKPSSRPRFGPTENRTAGIFRARVTVNFARRGAPNLSHGIYLWICISSASRCEDVGFHEGLAKNERSRERQVRLFICLHLCAASYVSPLSPAELRGGPKSIFEKYRSQFSSFRGKASGDDRSCEIAALYVARARNVSMRRWNAHCVPVCFINFEHYIGYLRALPLRSKAKKARRRDISTNLMKFILPQSILITVFT